MDEQIRHKLYQKMEHEFNSYIEKLKKLPPEKIILGSYEKIMKEEMMLSFYPDNEMYDINQIKALNNYDKPLDKLYSDWMDSDISFNGVIEDSITNTLNDLVKAQKEKNNSKER